MRPPPDVAASIQRALQVLQTLSACASLKPAVRAAAAEAMVDCPVPEDFVRDLGEGEVCNEQVDGIASATGFLQALDGQSGLEEDLQKQVTRALECLPNPDVLRRYAERVGDRGFRTSPTADDDEDIGLPTILPPRRVETVVELARARVGSTSRDDRRRQALAVAALLRAHADGALLPYVADHSADPQLLWALPQHPDLLWRIREAAKTGGQDAAILRRVTTTIDWRVRG